jgi:hypothetical protein
MGKEGDSKETERLHLAGKFMIMKWGRVYFSSKEKGKRV